MTEILMTVGAGVFWILPFVLLVAWIGRAGTMPLGPAVLAAYPVFFAALVLLAKVAGFSGFLHVRGVRLAWLGLTVGAAALWLGGRRRGMEAATPGPSAVGVAETPAASRDPDTALVRWIVLGLVGLAGVALTVFTLVSPVHVWDVLAYHMPMVASYVQNASLEPWPTQGLRQVYRVNAGEMQLLSVALLARSDAWVELPGLLGLGVFLVGTRELAHLVLPRRMLALLAVGFVLTAPQIVVAATTAKNDLTFSAVLLAAFYWAIRAGRGALTVARPVDPSEAGPVEPGRPAFHDDGAGPSTGLALALAALSAALAAATKVMGLNVMGATGMLLLVLAWRGRLRWRAVVGFSALAVVALGILAGDVYWRNLVREAIPVGVAPGELHLAFGLANLVEAARYYLYELSFRRLVVLPPFEHDFLHYGYLFPFALALGVLGAARQARRRSQEGGSLVLLAGALFLSVIVLRVPIRWDQRFMIWMVPVLGILALSLAGRVQARHLIALCGLIGGLGFVNLSTGLLLESDRLFLRSARHLATVGSLARYLDVPNERYRHRDRGFEVLAAAVSPSDAVLYGGTEDSWMYLAWGPRFTRRVEGVRDPEHAAAQVASNRFRFVVIEHAVRDDIGAAMAEAAEAAGYTPLLSNDQRTILVRPPPNPGAGEGVAAPGSAAGTSLPGERRAPG